jgi:hypothetical protein
MALHFARAEVRAAPDETHIGGFAGSRVSRIDSRNCRAEWIRERRLHQAGVPRSLPVHRQKIVQRKKAETDGKGEILKAALEEAPPLTAEEMAERLGFGCPRVLRRNFF